MGKEALSMRTRLAALAGFVVLGVGGFLLLALGRGQERSPSPPSTLAVPPAPAAATAKRPLHDIAKLSPLQQQMYRSAQLGAEWLARTNHADGHFDNGYIPALRVLLEGDHYLRQAGAASALARAARYTGDEHLTAIARQAVLTLLLHTGPDAEDAHLRHTTLPSTVVNRLGAAGLLVLAINELPAPGDDLLEQSEELCAFIRKQQRADGSLCISEAPGDPATEASDPDGINCFPGEALYALMLSQRHRPAAWKTDVVRKAMSYYRPWWRAHKTMALIPYQTAAYTEAYLLTKEQAFADCVTEMNDWLCGFQYVQIDASHPLWLGGFMGWMDGKPAAVAPQVGSAVYAEGLAEACRVARQAGDLARHRRYSDALERCLQFLVTLQYTDANTRHFADWYRPILIGGFFGAHQDGTLRIDYTQHAVCALVQYLVVSGSLVSGEW
jgi:hypothetical protein